MALDERQKVAHLLRRFGLGASESELDFYAEGGYVRAVERLLDYESVEEPFVLPLEDLKSGKNERVAMPAVVLWWTARMLTTRRPLQEKMTLFWHDHFATSASKVNAPLLMADQNETIRSLATDSFPSLLRAISRDPAMLFWLDNQENVSGKPNENFARELLELFTLGIGHYTEADVQETARAFTGWAFRRQPAPDRGGAVAEFQLRAGRHDSGIKTILGKTGKLSGEDVLEHLSQHPRTAEHLVQKLLVWFVQPEPQPATVKRFAAIFRESKLQIKPLLRAIMLSPEFVSERSVRSVVKSPVDFVIPTLRQVGAGEALADAYVRQAGQDPRRRLAVAAGAAQAMKSMGMWLLYPPDVAGWEGGKSWISSATMLERMKWSDRLFRGPVLAQRMFGNDAPGQVVDRIASVFDAPIVGAKRPAYVKAVEANLEKGVQPAVAAVGKLIFSSPEFQMN